VDAVPVSATSKRSTRCRPSAQTRRIVTEPCSVSFTALATRFNSTWCTRSGSNETAVLRQGTTSTFRSRPLHSASGVTAATTWSIMSSGSVTHAASSTSPASSFEKSSRSSTNAFDDSPICITDSARCRCDSPSAGSSASNSEKPSTPCSGVRSSWLTIATKSLFTFSDATA